MVSSSKAFYLIIFYLTIIHNLPTGNANSNCKTCEVGYFEHQPCNETQETLCRECRKCGAGFYVERQCNKLHDTLCARCPEGSFISQNWNLESKCNSCTVCPSGFYTSVQCTFSNDSQCESCDNIQDSENYRTACAKDISNTPNLDISGDSLKLDNIEETGSGENEVDVVLHQNVSIISEELVSPENETEGSGEVILDLPPEGLVPDDITTSKTPISESVSEIIDDDLIPVTKTAPRKSTTTIINTPKKTPASTSTTTEKTLGLGPGFELTDDSHDNTVNLDKVEDKTIVIEFVKTTTKPKSDENEVPVRPFLAERKTAEMADDSDKVSIGIVIAVAIIAAIVFFIIGFIVSKYCRKRRQEFKMMQKMEKNGGRHNGSIPVMLDMPNSYRQNGIYDEIGKEANGKCSSSKLDQIVPEQADNVYAIPEKRKKTEPDIKYIDETTDDEIDNKDSDTLLQRQEADDTEDIPSLPKEIDETGESVEEPADESTESSPMLQEINSEIDNIQENTTENDSLMVKS